MPTPKSDLSTSRYGGRRRLSRRTWIVISVVGVGLGILAAWFVAQYQTSNSFQADVIRFDVRSDHEIEVTIRVKHPSGDPASCDMAAQAQDHSYVGEKTFEIPRTQGDRTTITDTIATERRPVTAIVVGCRITD